MQLRITALRALTHLPAAVALLVLAHARGMGAQQPDLIPRELAVAHARLFAPEFISSDPTLVVGRVAEAAAAKIPTPPEAEIVGSVVWGSVVQVVGKAKGDPESVETWLWRALKDAGWKAPLPDISSLSAGGFVVAPDPSAKPAIVCKDNESVKVRTAPLDRSRSYYQITLKPDAYTCSRGPGTFGVTSWGGQKLPLPILYNPRDAEMNESLCNVRRSGSTHSEVSIATSLSAAALVGSYGKQLDSAGWTETTAKPSGAAGTWTRTDSAGTPMRAELWVVTVPSAPKCRLVRLDIWTSSRQ